MTHPKEAWKFKLWTEAMLRGAIVGSPEYKAKTTGSSSGTTSSNVRARKRRRRRKKRKNATKET